MKMTPHPTARNNVVDMKETQWRTIGYMLRLPLQTPCQVFQQAMDWYFEIPDNAKLYKGNQRRTLPVVLHYNIAEANTAGNMISVV